MPIPLQPCLDFKPFFDHHDVGKSEQIQKHVQAGQFLCPVEQDLVIYGNRNDFTFQELAIRVETLCGSECSQTDLDYFDNKELIMLLNE